MSAADTVSTSYPATKEDLEWAQAELVAAVVLKDPYQLPGRVQQASAILRVHMRRHRFDLASGAYYDAATVLAEYARFLGVDEGTR